MCLFRVSPESLTRKFRVKCSIKNLFLMFQGEVQALFLRHEGYLGAIGAFLKGAEEDSKLKAVKLWKMDF